MVIDIDLNYKTTNDRGIKKPLYSRYTEEYMSKDNLGSTKLKRFIKRYRDSVKLN